jgi:hypothetical protein
MLVLLPRLKRLPCLTNNLRMYVERRWESERKYERRESFTHKNQRRTFLKDRFLFIGLRSFRKSYNWPKTLRNYYL